MDAREKYEARAKNRKSIDLTQTNPDDPLHRSLLEQKQQERNQNNHRRTQTTYISNNNLDSKKAINDILADQNFRNNNANLEVKVNTGAPILFVNNRIEFGKAAMKINSKIVIKKDEPVKLDRPELERSNTTAPTSESRGDSKSDSRRDKPDVDPLSRRLVNDSFNLKNPHHHKQQSLPPTLADLNNHMSESQMDANQLINDAQSIQQALDKSMNEKAEKPSFIVAEKVIFSNNEKKKQFTIIPTDESDKKVNRFAYIKAYANLDESLQTSPSTSASSNPTPTKASSIDPSPTKTIDPSPLKITGKLNLEHVPIDEGTEEKLKLISKVKEDYQRILELDMQHMGIYIAPSLDTCLIWNGIIFANHKENKRSKYRFELRLNGPKPRVFFTSKPEHPAISPVTGEFDLKGCKDQNSSYEILIFIRESINKNHNVNDPLKKSNLEWVKGASKPVEDDQLYMNKGDSNEKFKQKLSEFILSLGDDVTGAARVEKILQFTRENRV